MPIEQLEVLLSDPSMQEAIAVVLDRSDGGSAELEWSDVSDDLSESQWGRLLGEGVLVSTGSGFAVAEPDRIRSHLSEDGTEAANGETGPDEPDPEDPLADLDLPSVESERWTTFDKTAGIITVLLFVGYWNSSIRGTIAGAENAILGPVLSLVPFHIVIILLAIATGLYSTLLQARLTDQEKLGKYRERMQKLQERRKTAKEQGDEEALEALQEKQLAAAGDQLGMLKQQFRPLVWTMLLTIPVFLWLRWKVNGGHLGGAADGLVVPLAGAVSGQESLAGPIATWIVWYFLCSVAARQLIQKTLNVQTGAPS
jgi:uncharacterized membrane protein (DUF106 family)